VERDAAELCIPAVARFAERSCAAPKAAQPDAPQPELLAKRPLKRSEALPQEEPVLREAAPGVLTAH
jgi:hypothetical protein